MTEEHQDSMPLDPELEGDLGAELPLRGDVLEADLAAARREAEEWQDKALRAQAEFENARRRLEARHSDALLRAGERVVTELLPVIDDLERAAEHIAAESEQHAEGVFAVVRKMLAVLTREGATPIDPIGEPFDMERHNAVQTRESDEVPEGTVVEVLQKGYEMHGRVLRPAMVVVSTGGPGEVG